MKPFLLATSLILAPFIVNAEEDFSDLIEQLEKFDAAHMNRGEYLDQMETIFPDLSVAAFLLFTRARPELNDYAPDFTWSEAYEEAFGCMYDQTAGVGNYDDLKAYTQGGLVSLQYLRDNPDLNFMTMTEHPEYMDSVTPSSAYLRLLKDCGVQQLSQDAMMKSGMMEALQKVASQ